MSMLLFLFMPRPDSINYIIFAGIIILQSKLTSINYTLNKKRR